MLRSYKREKLINTIIFFASNTEHLGKIKLFKLLYLLDFEHFQATGVSVTGLEYRAWKLGPVPLELYREWKSPKPDLAEAVGFVRQTVIDYSRETVVPAVEFDDSHFSKRELRILRQLADKYLDGYSKAMIDVTHAENGAWAKIWDNGRGRNQPIGYELAVPEDSPQREAILALAREYEAVARSHKH